VPLLVVVNPWLLPVEFPPVVEPEFELEFDDCVMIGNDEIVLGEL